MPSEFLKLTGEELSRLPRQQTVFFFPVGPMEDHGPHLPLGLDLEEATTLCRMAAERVEKEMPGWVGLVMPAAPLGIQANTKTAVIVRHHVLRDWLVDSCRCLRKMGFLHFVSFSGHLGPKQLTAIEEAGKFLARGRHWVPLPSRGKNTPALISACSALVPAREVLRSPFWPDAREHGGKRDTSVALHAGARVADGYAQLSSLTVAPSFWARWTSRLSRRNSGYWGSPAEAHADHGRALLTGTLDEVFPKMRAVWEGSNPNHLFRSWYSVLPPNQGFFKIWLLAFVLLVLLWFWVSFSVRHMLAS